MAGRRTYDACAAVPELGEDRLTARVAGRRIEVVRDAATRSAEPGYELIHRSARCGFIAYSRGVPGLRTYGESCAMSHALDLVGERWALLVVRELVYGPKRFTDLRHGLRNASPNVLSQRLRELEEIGVLRRRRLGPPVGAWAYELTDWGRELEPVLLGLTRWGDRSPLRVEDGVVSPDSLMFALRCRFDPAADPDLEAGYHVRLGDDAFDVRVAAGVVSVRRGEPRNADALVEIDTPTFRELVYGRVAPADAAGDGHLRVVGDEKAVERLFAAVTGA
jgi:DNA-binding HxlR family transcriptional regulator